MAREDVATWAAPGFRAVVSTQADESQLVLLSGDIDLATAGALREAFVSPRVLDAPAVRVDLTGVTFLGSVGIGVMVSACKRIRSSGGTFSVVSGRDLCLTVLQVSGLIDYLQVEDVA